MSMTRAVVIAGMLAACGGGKDEPAAGSAAPAAAPTPRDTIVDAWKKAGLQPTAMAAATVPIGKDCQTGTINDVDVVMCLFATAEQAKAAEKPGWEWIGSTTGSAWVSGSVVIAVADRKKADPNGKTINQLMKLAPKS